MSVPTVGIAGVPDPLPEGLAVVDVREPVEWQYGHIEGAIHIPLGELQGRLDEVPEGQTLVVCKVGGRSAQAVGLAGAAGPRRGQPGRRDARLGGGRTRDGERDRPAAAGRLSSSSVRALGAAPGPRSSPLRSGHSLAM